MARAMIAVVLTLVAASPAFAASDPIEGKKIAKRWCASCHVISPEQQTRASADVPSFCDIAQRKSGAQLKLFLIDPHPKMPDMSLTRQEIADIVAYIESLKP
jgi:mono/diheme cytochrome c family protein